MVIQMMNINHLPVCFPVELCLFILCSHILKMTAFSLWLHFKEPVYLWHITMHIPVILLALVYCTRIMYFMNESNPMFHFMFFFISFFKSDWETCFWGYFYFSCRPVRRHCLQYVLNWVKYRVWICYKHSCGYLVCKWNPRHEFCNPRHESCTTLFQVRFNHSVQNSRTDPLCLMAACECVSKTAQVIFFRKVMTILGNRLCHKFLCQLLWWN